MLTRFCQTFRLIIPIGMGNLPTGPPPQVFESLDNPCNRRDICYKAHNDCLFERHFPCHLIFCMEKKHYDHQFPHIFPWFFGEFWHHRFIGSQATDALTPKWCRAAPWCAAPIKALCGVLSTTPGLLISGADIYIMIFYHILSRYHILVDLMVDYGYIIGL